jgi:hypothetical protein
MLTAKILSRRSAPLAEIGFEASGLVVDARMDDAGVVSGLVPRQILFLFNEQHGGIGIALLQLPSGGNPHDTAADNHEIIGFHGHWPLFAKAVFESEELRIEAGQGLTEFGEFGLRTVHFEARHLGDF